MGLFRRRVSEPAERIPEFWAWWAAQGADSCAAAIAAGTPDRVADEVSARVHAIHPDLAWELAPGQISAHTLVVTAEGSPELRPVARRWLLAAAAADETWSYDDKRAAAEDPEATTLSGGPGAPDIRFADVSVAARKAGTRLDVTVHHPAFPELPDDARLQVAF